MARFHSTEETFKTKSKNSGPGDSPYHIFTPDDSHVQHETADTCTFSTFHPQYKGSSTNTGNSFMASLPLNYRSTTNKEDSFSSSLPRYGSHGSKTAHYNRSMDNIATTFVKSLPPRGQYHASTTDNKPSTTKCFSSRQEHHHRLNFPQPSTTSTSQRKDMYVNEFDIGNPIILEGLSHEDESLQLPKNVVHRNAAYECVVRRPFQEIGYHSPVFDIEVEREEFATDSEASSNQQIHGSGTNFFEMYSDDGSKNDLNQFSEQNRIKISSSYSLNTYENVKEACSSKAYGDHAPIPKPEPKNVSSTSSMKFIDGVPSVQESIQENTEKSTAYKFKADYENIKEYTPYEHDDMREWIPLAAVPTAIPQLDLEMSQLAKVPKIVVEAEHDKANEDMSDVQQTEQSELLQGTASLGKDLRKSVDVETLSDYEEMASSFSSHYNQQTFPFLSSTDIEGVQTTVKQEEEDEENLNTTDPTGDTQHNKQASLETKGNQQPIVHKNKKAKCFQYCLIFVTFAIATAALVMSTVVYIKIGDNSVNNTTSHNE